MRVWGILGVFICLPIWANETIYLLDTKSLSDPEKVTASSLVGLVAKESAALILASQEDSLEGNQQFWIKEYQKLNPSLRTEWLKDLPTALQHFSKNYSGYVLYGPGNYHVNEATSVAGPLKALVVNEKTEPLAKALGLSCRYDARRRSMAQIADEFADSLSWDLIGSLNPEISHHLRDYLIYQNAPIFFDGHDTETLLARQNPLSLILGWGPSEFNLFQQASRHNLQALAADFLLNASVQSQWKIQIPRQRRVASLPSSPAVHYVAFVMSDGDNPQWLNNTFVFDSNWWASPHRGKFAMNWDLSAGVADLIPLTVKHLYETARRDYFVAAHGYGSDYPSEVPRLREVLHKSVRYMAAIDLKILSVLDNRWDPKTLDLLLEPEEVEGVMVKSNWGCGYACLEGRIHWRGDKPAVGVKYSLWEGYGTAESISTALNQAPRDLSDERAYSIVNIHPWSPTPMENVAKLIARLDPAVKVVTLDEFFQKLRLLKRVRPNEGRPRIFFGRGNGRGGGLFWGTGGKSRAEFHRRCSGDSNPEKCNPH